MDGRVDELKRCSYTKRREIFRGGVGADLWNEGPVNLLQDVVHLYQFGLNEWTVRSTDVADVVEAEVVKDENVPVVSLQGTVQMPGHVVVNLHREWGIKNR